MPRVFQPPPRLHTYSDIDAAPPPYEVRLHAFVPPRHIAILCAMRGTRAVARALRF